MENTITQAQAQALETKIYDLLMQNPEMDMGDMGNCLEAASDLVSEWIVENNIQLID